MTANVNSKFSKVNSVVAVGLLAVGIVAAPSAWAGKGSEKSAGQAVEVVGKVELAGGPATSMVLVEKGRKHYLYVTMGPSARLSIVDVTDAKKARLVEQTAIPDPSALGQLQPVGDSRAMILTTPQASATPSMSGANSQAVTILDVQNPANPTVARVFHGVTSFVTDDGRSLIYVADADGLWILMAKDKTQAAPSLAEEQND
jgi:hypothetical protein